MRRSVSMALRIEVSGFLISCATSAANRSIASIRVHSAVALSDSACASSPISSRRPSRRRETLPARPRPSRMSCAARARRSSGRAMVRERYHDSATVSTRATMNRLRIDMRIENSALSTSRAARVSTTMPIVWRLRSTGSATVTSSRCATRRM